LDFGSFPLILALSIMHFLAFVRETDSFGGYEPKNLQHTPMAVLHFEAIGLILV